jgi:hypothetical protein
MTPTRDLDVYDIACLAGGRDRMVDAALVALVQSGRVRVHRPGQLATVGLARRHPVEAAVLDAVGPVGHRSVDTVRWRLAADERLLEATRRLHREGLLGRHHPHLPGRRSDGPTLAGRRLLHRLSADPPQDDVAPGTDAMDVALHGRENWPAHDPRAEIFVTREVRRFAHGSRSPNPAEAAAENQRDVRRTPAVLHSAATDWGAPYGPNPSLRSTHWGRP